jgi:hypothetical protein
VAHSLINARDIEHVFVPERWSYCNVRVVCVCVCTRGVGAEVCVLERARHRSANQWRTAGGSAASEMLRWKLDARQVCACCAHSEKSVAHAALGEGATGSAAAELLVASRKTRGPFVKQKTTKFL